MTTCPHCNARDLHHDPVYNAVSRHDNVTAICAPCGTDEAMLDYYSHGIGSVWPGHPGPVDRATVIATLRGGKVVTR